MKTDVKVSMNIRIPKELHEKIVHKFHDYLAFYGFKPTLLILSKEYHCWFTTSYDLPTTVLGMKVLECPRPDTIEVF